MLTHTLSLALPPCPDPWTLGLPVTGAVGVSPHCWLRLHLWEHLLRAIVHLTASCFPCGLSLTFVT